MSKHTEKDTAKETGSSAKDVSRAFHDARNDAVGRGELSERNSSKTSDSSGGSFLESIFKIVGLK